MTIDQEIARAKRLKDFELVKDLEETKIYCQIQDLQKKYKKYEKSHFQGAMSAYQNACDTIHEKYGKHWHDVTLEQKLEFWYLATDLDTIEEMDRLLNE
jgi:ribosome-binding factor A